MNPQYAYGHHTDQRPHLVDPANPDLLVCGAKVGKSDHTRDGPPEKVSGLHLPCLLAWRELVQQGGPVTAECSVCGGTVQVVRGVLVRHGVWRVGADGPVETGARCGGGGVAVGGAA